MLQRWRIDSTQTLAATLRPVAGALRSGEVVAIPTETFYGLAAFVGRPDALQAILRLKGRKEAKPLPLIVDSIDMARSWMLDPPAWFADLAGRFWPGPLTLVVSAIPGLSPPVIGAAGSIALRIPAHPVARALVTLCAAPLTATSANRSGQPAMRHPDDVAATLGPALRYLVDDGSTPGGLPSTLLDIRPTPPRLLRHGALGVDRIDAVLSDLGMASLEIEARDSRVPE